MLAATAQTLTTWIGGVDGDTLITVKAVSGLGERRALARIMGGVGSRIKGKAANAGGVAPALAQEMIGPRKYCHSRVRTGPIHIHEAAVQTKARTA